MNLSDIDKDIQKKLNPEDDPLPKFDRRRKYTLDQIVAEMESKGFKQPSDLMAARHGSTVQFVRQGNGVADPKQHHWRVWKKNKIFKIEAHEDLVSPSMEKYPGVGAVGHAVVDVGVVAAARRQGKNLNNTRQFTLKRNRDK